ncbi:spinster family MFS transporter [Terricaulis silvestris]|uniref:L-galactonate transporter n=1 Tax=Terricaulis silvestris TaxID=2686094 RepID=A0A6I6MLP5_9CAUL|nr:MFS transporter [Terricaulis silvestris]QGZ94931.1 L-galactonate transporter [Terricaulis silvestris]
MGAQATVNASQGWTQTWPPARAAWWAVAVLTTAYIVSFVDRQILSLLIEPIRADLAISDTQVSLLGGFAFALLYTFAGIPLAWVGDHHSRRWLIAAGAAFWSVMTALCGLSQTFWQMFWARVGVGVGEASLTPSAYSLMGDYFPPDKLGRPMGVYMAGGAVGSGVALVVGGAVIAATATLPSISVPLVGALKPWQLVFVIVAIPGLVVALLALTVREPKRVREPLQPAPAQREGRKIGPNAARYLGRNWRLYLPLFGGFALISLMKNAILIWTPTMFMRAHGWDASSIGYWYGAFLLTLGPLGAIGGGWIADHLRGRGIREGALWVVVVATCASAPIAVSMPLVQSSSLALVLLALLTFVLFVVGSVTPTAFQLATPNQMRAQVSAVALFVNNLLGIGFGPTLVALITDYVFGADSALSYSIAIVALVFAPLSALAFWLALSCYRAAAPGEAT